MIISRQYRDDAASRTKVFLGWNFESIGPQKLHNFGHQEVRKYREKDIIDISDTHITLKFLNGDKRFKIDAIPGRYCSYCDEALENESNDTPSSQQGAAARKHVADKHKGEKSPDDSSPGGYKMHNCYRTTMEA
jgi:hypothetical protein